MTDSSATGLHQAFAELIARDDQRTRHRFFDALLASRIYMTHRDGPQLTGTAYRLEDGSLSMPAFTDEIALRTWIRKDTPYGTMPAKSFFSAALKMGVDNVMINPGGAALQINRPSMILLARGINPASIPQASITVDT